MSQTITALFDSVAQAERAANDLATRIGGVRGTIYSTNTASKIDTLSIPNEDRAVLQENVRRGGAVFYAEVPDEKFQAAADALEAAGALDYEEREVAWRREGWSGTAAPTSSSTTTGAARSPGTTGDESIPIVEERLKVGKRQTSHGRVRVRSYVVETPVQEQVTLHQERVQVERRPTDRPLAAGDEAFRERVIEATETSEEAVVSKEARVKEEVVIRKTADDRTETVRDTVRRTEVEIEDERGQAGTPKRDRT